MVANNETRSNRGAELVGLLAFALSLMLLIALATFDPRDPAPFFKAGAAGTARNFIGPFGAFLAELLIPQLFGLAALLQVVEALEEQNPGKLGQAVEVAVQPGVLAHDVAGGLD